MIQMLGRLTPHNKEQKKKWTKVPSLKKKRLISSRISFSGNITQGVEMISERTK